MDADEKDDVETRDEIWADIQSSLETDINDLREALCDLTENPAVMSAIHALKYGNDALNAAVKLRQALSCHLDDWAAAELDRRVSGAPSVMEARIARSIAAARGVPTQNGYLNGDTVK
jgi:hypothetical protein